jgi:hypothetical protein
MGPAVRARLSLGAAGYPNRIEWYRITAGVARGLGAVAVGVALYALDLGVLWTLVVIWAIGTAACLIHITIVARREHRPPSIRLLFRRGPLRRAAEDRRLRSRAARRLDLVRASTWSTARVATARAGEAGVASSYPREAGAHREPRDTRCATGAGAARWRAGAARRGQSQQRPARPRRQAVSAVATSGPLVSVAGCRRGPGTARRSPRGTRARPTRTRRRAT